MALPYLVTRSMMVLKTRGNKSLVSLSFIGKFEGYGERVINSKSWVLTSLVKPCEIGPENETLLTRDECPLYFQDWATL